MTKLPEAGRAKRFLCGSVLGAGWFAMAVYAWYGVLTPYLYSRPPYTEMRAVSHAQDGDLRTVADDLESRFHDGLLPYLEQRRDTLTQYHIADTLGAFYNIRFDRYDKYYDLFLAGNLGAKTPEDVVRETIEREPGGRFIIWADPETESVPGYQDEAVKAALRLIRSACTLTDTLLRPDGTPSYSVYLIPAAAG